MRHIRTIKIIGRNYELSVLVDENDYQTLNLGSYKWHRVIGQATTYVATSNKGKTLYLHRLITGLENASRSIYVDHIDHNGLNNSRDNLRITDNKGNQQNQRKHLSDQNHSCYKGVTKHSYNKSNPWIAHITLSGKIKHLGNYRTEEEAALSYNRAAIEHFGSMANLNIITP